jgi:hypothetical protein
MQTTRKHKYSSFTEFQARKKKTTILKEIETIPANNSQLEHQKYFMEEKEKEKEIKRLILLKQYTPLKPVKLDDIMMKFDYFHFEEL